MVYFKLFLVESVCVYVYTCTGHMYTPTHVRGDLPNELINEFIYLFYSVNKVWGLRTELLLSKIGRT